MGNLLIDLGDLHSELKKKVATELRKSDGKSVSMKDVISQLVKLYIDNDELKYHNLSRKMEKVVKENNRQKKYIKVMNEPSEVNEEEMEKEEQVGKKRVRLSSSSFSSEMSQ